ncbi:ABC-type multidrug transport system ATPase subunit [Saonia flava]|uniref:ABC-type multidrug transport system ATPase subunit n=1 Tax=Saonia flava TaxID=523696 RepID=A0A846QZA2_9FLAO|nr:ATP-binding cassette domain-containing protein [Saonia flava]NJB72527.1 ABC-type multidrug transport system ATPase subunit [Saonia flava]
MILEVDNIELSYNDKKIIHSIYLRAETGKITGILGRNGCGKTTLLRIIFGDLLPKYKNIRIDGTYQKSKLFTKNIIGYLPQNKLLPNSLKLSKAFKWYQLNWEQFTGTFTSFKKYKNLKINELSSGELRVIETYLTLCSSKQIILLDEPFSFIAPIYIEKFKSLMESLKKEKLIILTDHFYRDILEISDSIYFLKNGYSKLIVTREDLENEGYLIPN